MEKTELLIHLRNMDDEGKINSRGGRTFYAHKVGSAWNVEVAMCCSKDNYNKAVGRAIVKGRIKKFGPMWQWSLQEVLKNLVDNAKEVGDKRTLVFFSKLVSKLGTA
jgi:hypothetical protein